MVEPAVKLSKVAEATEELHGVAGQALEWVRQSEARVAEAEKSLAETRERAEKAQAEVKERARAALAKIGAEGRERIAAEREKRRAVEARVAHAEEARDRAEKAFERAGRRAEADRETFVTQQTTDKIAARESPENWNFGYLNDLWANHVP